MKKKTNEIWLNKQVFYAMVVLVVASTVTSCTTIMSKPTKIITKQPIIFDVPNIEEREYVFACDLVSGLYICDRLES